MIMLIIYRPLELESRRVLINSFCPAVNVESSINEIEAFILNGSLVDACEAALVAQFWEIALVIAARLQGEILSKVVATVIGSKKSSSRGFPTLSPALKNILLLFGGSYLDGKRY